VSLYFLTAIFVICVFSFDVLITYEQYRSIRTQKYVSAKTARTPIHNLNVFTLLKPAKNILYISLAAQRFIIRITGQVSLFTKNITLSSVRCPPRTCNKVSLVNLLRRFEQFSNSKTTKRVNGL